MKPAHVFWILAASGLAGWYAPDLAPASGGGARAGADTAATAQATVQGEVAADRNAAWLAGQTVLQRQPDGHFYATATIDHRDYRFLVDTGASVVALTGRDASEIGLHWDDSDLMHIGRGANGEVYGVPVVIERIELGGFEARQVEAAIIPDGLDMSLLGQSFLSRLGIVEISRDQMRLGG